MARPSMKDFTSALSSRRRARHLHQARARAAVEEAESERRSGEVAVMPSWSALRGPFAHALRWFVATRAALVVCAIIARHVFAGLRGLSRLTPTGSSWLDVWAAFDVGWYLRIAAGGYPTISTFNPARQDVYAFFPGLPLMSRWLGALVGGPYVAGMILANASLLVAATLLHAMVRHDFGEAVARRAVRYLFLFPSAFLLSAMLTEGPFLALSLAALFLARRDRWIWAALAAFALGLTRSTGVLLVPALLLEALETRRIDLRVVLGVCAAGLGVGAVMLMNEATAGDPLAFVHIQAAWGAHLGNPVRSILQGVFLIDVPRQLRLTSRVMVGFAIFAIAALAAAHRAGVRRSWVLFGALLVTAPLFRSWYGMPRYVLVAFALYVGVAKVTETREELDLGLSAAFAILQGSLFAFWSNGFEFVV
ncbi:MAG: hypothetical protein R3A48_24525 [Polyangiales bacterium]